LGMKETQVVCLFLWTDKVNLEVQVKHLKQSVALEAQLVYELY